MANLSALNRFAMNPVGLNIGRSRFSRPSTLKTTFNSGDLVPVFWDEVLPGDTFTMNTSAVIRELTPAVPVMDNSYLDLYFFFVPNRIACAHDKDWAKICGENVDGFWANQTEYTLDNTGNMFDLALDNANILSMSVPNYLGLPIISLEPVTSLKVSKLPFAALNLIYNEWFRDQNTQAPIDIETVLSGSDSGYAIGDAVGEHYPYKVNKFHDYFTSALQSPQKGDSVLLPLVGEAPVYLKEDLAGSNSYAYKQSGDKVISDYNIHTLPTSGKVASQSDVVNIGITKYDVEHGKGHSASYADLSGATAATINQLRLSFAIQRMLEKDARGGTRYREMLKNHFGVTIPDATAQVPEYLGGKRIPLNIDQVLQTSASASEPSPLGTTGAFSNTSFSDHGFTKSFTEYGMVLGVACVRTSQSYSQGISKAWTRNRRFDFYLPAFANIGEQPIYKRELFVDPNDVAKGDEVFGYQEAWAEYRYKPNMITGNLAPNAKDETLTPWTYTNNFSTTPVLNSDFMKQPTSQIGDTLTDTTTTTQFIADFYFDLDCVRPMPVYSIPGLLDHN